MIRADIFRAIEDLGVVEDDTTPDLRMSAERPVREQLAGMRGRGNQNSQKEIRMAHDTPRQTPGEVGADRFIGQRDRGAALGFDVTAEFHRATGLTITVRDTVTGAVCRLGSVDQLQAFLDGVDGTAPPLIGRIDAAPMSPAARVPAALDALDELLAADLDEDDDVVLGSDPRDVMGCSIEVAADDDRVLIRRIASDGHAREQLTLGADVARLVAAKIVIAAGAIGGAR